MAVRAYFDDSGKSHDPSCKFVALAGYLATLEAWERFEPRWEQFKKNNDISHMHSSELNAGREGYSQLDRYERAFVRSDVTLLMRDFVNDFKAFACIISMEDYRAVAEKKTIPRPERICADECLGNLVQECPADEDLQLFYDRGEGFFASIHNQWRNKKHRRDNPKLNRVNIFSEVDDSRNCSGVQAADYLAYCAAKGVQGAYRWRWRMLTAGLKIYRKDFRKADLLKLATA